MLLLTRIRRDECKCDMRCLYKRSATSAIVEVSAKRLAGNSSSADDPHRCRY